MIGMTINRYVFKKFIIYFHHRINDIPIERAKIISLILLNKNVLSIIFIQKVIYVCKIKNILINIVRI